MLWKRVLTAIVLLPPLVWVVVYGRGVPFSLLVGAVALLCAIEYFRMFFTSFRDKVSGVAVTGLVYLSGVVLPHRVAWAAVLCCVALAAFHFLSGDGTPADKLRGAGISALGAVYIGGFLTTYPRTILLPSGERWVLLGLVAIFAGDTFAYFAGKTFGRRPLSPGVSPNKTVEGAAGGLAASVLLGTGFGAAFLPAVPLWFVAVTSGAVGAVGQAGDLFESLLKRAAGVKDSGALLPGHGGMFDRTDALISAGPALYLLATLAPLAGVPG